MIRLKETNNDPSTAGIFHTIQALGKFAWLDGGTLDIEYYLQRSGEKYISPLMACATSLDVVAKIIVAKFADKWNRLYDAFITTTYNPIDNYSMTESEKTATKIKVNSSGTAGTYGFNSDTAVPTGKSDTETISEGNADDNIRTSTRTGNIGVTTSQQMLNSEIELRRWSFYEMLFDDVDSLCTLSVYD